jgi:RimJ/RimL family protein N-acetyltransferase
VEDFPHCAAMWSDPVITRYTIGSPSPAQRSWLRLLGYLGHWSALGFGYWALVERATDTYIGELGFADFKREIDLLIAIEGRPELGWVLASHAHGKGFATEALRAVVAWGDQHLSSKETVCIIHPSNLVSVRVAEKLGFSESARGQGEILFSRNRWTRFL